MRTLQYNHRIALMVGACALATTLTARAAEFNVPSGDLEAALNAYSAQSGVQLMVSSKAVKGIQTHGVRGELPPNVALSRILSGTGFVPTHDAGGGLTIVKGASQGALSDDERVQLAQAAPVSKAPLETVTVTSSKLGGADVQSIPISITALSQEQLTSRQIAGGPDLVKEVPNLTFSKTNFTGYNIEIRGIGTQAISVTTDPAVAVAFNDIPFIRNHFFEQEFYDLGQAEVLRGPQGTLYGRNATAGVVNLVSAKPTDQFEALASADIGNYNNRRFEGMINIPIVDDRVDLRIAGEWTKRDGYSFNSLTNAPIDGRDLWSGRMTIGWKPTSDIQSYFVWEHFSEDDDRLRSGKQLCKTAPLPPSVSSLGSVQGFNAPANYLSQGCEDTSLYSSNAFEVPNGSSLSYYWPLAAAGVPVVGGDPYPSLTQSTNLRQIKSTINPTYRAKNDTLEWNTNYQINPALIFTSQTGYNRDFLWSAEDYNRFNSNPGVFTVNNEATFPDPNAGKNGVPLGAGVFCDPQLGCSDRLVLEDLSDEQAWQISQEFRLASNSNGPFNFSVGGNFLHYETEENYYVFINSLTLLSVAANVGQAPPYVPGVSDNSQCLPGGKRTSSPVYTGTAFSCHYVDPNPISSLDNEGHNYFLSQNPYVLNSYAGFGEAYYDVTRDLKLTLGARWTDDQKHFVDIPSELLTQGYGYPVTAVVNQEWDRWTGRFVANWTPDFGFTDKTLIYASVAHGYKAGGANPPGPLFPNINGGGLGSLSEPDHPLTFKPEYINAFELGAKNTLLDSALTLNGDTFYYNYSNYQISEIVDRTAINDNFNAHVEGAELEAQWEPLPGLKFNLAQGFEQTGLAGGDQGIDLMDRTAGNPDWVVVKPSLTQASNCIVPVYVALALTPPDTCNKAYFGGLDPITDLPYKQDPAGYTYSPSGPGGTLIQYPGFDPLSIDPAAPANVNNGLGLSPNNGEGFNKDLGGKQLPNAPHFTTSVSAEYTMPVSADWAATLHGDFYWQSQQWARVFEDAIDNIRPYSTTNLALIFTNQNGWQAMATSRTCSTSRQSPEPS